MSGERLCLWCVDVVVCVEGVLSFGSCAWCQRTNVTNGRPIPAPPTEQTESVLVEPYQYQYVRELTLTTKPDAKKGDTVRYHSMVRPEGFT